MRTMSRQVCTLRNNNSHELNSSFLGSSLTVFGTRESFVTEESISMEGESMFVRRFFVDFSSSNLFNCRGLRPMALLFKEFRTLRCVKSLSFFLCVVALV